MLWDIRTGEQVFAVRIDDGVIPALNFFSHDGQELMVGQGATGGLLVLDARTGAKRRIIAPEETAGLGRWSLSPDGSTLAVLLGSPGRPELTQTAVAFYDAVTGRPGLKIPLATEGIPKVITWSPDGRRLALGSGYRPRKPQVTIWDTETGRLLLTLNREEQIGRIRFSPDGSRLLHIASDNRVSFENPTVHPIHIWDATPIPEN